MAFNLEITNLNLVAYQQELLTQQNKCYLTADSAAGSGTLTVSNISGFSVGQYILIGNFGEQNAEIIRIHAATTPSGTTITLASNTVNDHYTDSPVTVIDYNQVEFSRATTLAGIKSVLATQDIQANRTTSIYTDLTNTTGYGFYRFKNSATTTYSEYSSGVAYTGNDSLNSFQALAEEACRLADVAVDSEYARLSVLLGDANEAQDTISQKQDWYYELVTNDTSISVSTNENTYSLSDLTYTVKYPMSYQGILDVRFSNHPLDVLSIDEMDWLYRGTSQTTLAATATVGATSITLTDSTTFQEQGVVFVGANTVNYTANDTSTGVLSGISASDITVEVASGENVWQNISPSKPTQYAIFGGNIILNCPVQSTYDNHPLKFRYLKKIDRLTSYASTTEVPFYNAISSFMAAKIETRKRNKEEAVLRMAEFNEVVAMNQGLYKLPQLQEMTYYGFRSLEEWNQDKWQAGYGPNITS